MLAFRLKLHADNTSAWVCNNVTSTHPNIHADRKCIINIYLVYWHITTAVKLFCEKLDIALLMDLQFKRATAILYCTHLVA